jgi:glycosyltransferase involved in cell wall biosynthesis
MMPAAAAVSYRVEIETPAPLRAPAGRLKIQGWCLAPAAAAPLVRLAAGKLVLPRTSVLSRPDVVSAVGGDPAAAGCGFLIEGRLPPGAHLLTLEASADGRAWSPVRELCVVSTHGELAAAVEWPAGPVVRESVRVQGWCVHPDFPLAEVWLHYGNKQLRCGHGLPRTDVAALAPGAPDAARAGFIAEKNIPVGCSPLRLKAVAPSGEVFFARPPVAIDIDRDEDHPEPIDLHGRFPRLDGARRSAPPEPPAGDGARLHVLFVLYGDFTSNSAIHVANFARELARAGHACTVAVPKNPETVSAFPGARFTPVSHAALLAGTERFDVVHAWTTRENVRLCCAALRAAGRAGRLFVHLEDHELHILAATLGRPLDGLLKLPAAELDALVPPTLSHPRHSRTFLESADGVTVIVDRLRELVPAGRPVRVIWPAADERTFFGRPIPWDFRRALGWDEAHTVLFYHGNVHATNAAEMRELYAAVVRLNENGRPVTLVRCGRDDTDFLGQHAARAAPHVVALGQVPNHYLPALMALADLFVQPGVPDPFNDYRFPSKLPEFFALGRPVILPRTNLGAVLRHGEDAWVLERADAAGIVAAVRALQADPALRARLARGAADFAATNFSWAKSTEALREFYRSVPARG